MSLRDHCQHKGQWHWKLGSNFQYFDVVPCLFPGNLPNVPLFQSPVSEPAPSRFIFFQAAKNHNDPATFQLKICMCRVWIIAAYRGRKWIYLFLLLFMSVISDICWSHKWPYSGVWKRCAVVSPWLYSVFEPSVQKQISAPLLQEYVRQRIPSIKYWVGSLRRCAQLFGSASS